jgi:hypothetical protein
MNDTEWHCLTPLQRATARAMHQEQQREQRRQGAEPKSYKTTTELFYEAIAAENAKAGHHTPDNLETTIIEATAPGLNSDELEDAVRHALGIED